jgi:hypothetical protein
MQRPQHWLEVGWGEVSVSAVLPQSGWWSAGTCKEAMPMTNNPTTRSLQSQEKRTDSVTLWNFQVKGMVKNIYNYIFIRGCSEKKNDIGEWKRWWAQFLVTHIHSYTHFWDRVLVCSPGWPWTPDPPVSASQLLGLQAWATTTLAATIFFIDPDNISTTQGQAASGTVFIWLSKLAVNNLGSVPLGSGLRGPTTWVGFTKCFQKEWMAPARLLTGHDSELYENNTSCFKQLPLTMSKEPSTGDSRLF